MSNKIQNPTVLAFERKLDPSDAIFRAGSWDDHAAAANWPTLAIREKSVRGTMSSRKQAKETDTLKLDGSEKNANLQTVDVAMLPADADTLQVQFTLRVLAGAGTPSACNNVDYQAKLQQTVQTYVQQHGFTELANRYAANLANGRFLWRNRQGAEMAEIQVSVLKNGQADRSWTFDALNHSLRALTTSHSDVQALGSVIADGLANKGHVLLQVTAFVRMGAGLEVFPSQELILKDKKKDKDDKKSKTLYHVDGVAAMHSQKIGNAIRTIDTWYDGAAELGPIAVEPYGSVTTQGKAYRQQNPAKGKEKLDFYTLLDNWLLKDQVPAVEQQHFVMAVLIRGGVFGDAS